MDDTARIKMMNELVFEMTVHRPHIRRGQAMFIVLHQHRPDLADKVTGTDVDPFYLDHRTEAFLMWLGAELKAEQEAE